MQPQELVNVERNWKQMSMERWEDGVQSKNGGKSHKEKIMVVNIAIP